MAPAVVEFGIATAPANLGGNRHKDRIQRFLEDATDSR
jgi:hypothetical protein